MARHSSTSPELNLPAGTPHKGQTQRAMPENAAFVALALLTLDLLGHLAIKDVRRAPGALFHGRSAGGGVCVLLGSLFLVLSP